MDDCRTGACSAQIEIDDATAMIQRKAEISLHGQISYEDVANSVVAKCNTNMNATPSGGVATAKDNVDKHYEKSTSLGSGGSMVARPKLDIPSTDIWQGKGDAFESIPVLVCEVYVSKVLLFYYYAVAMISKRAHAARRSNLMMRWAMIHVIYVYIYTYITIMLILIILCDIYLLL